MVRLTQAKINTWLTCKRRFQLQYFDCFKWPREPYQAGAVDAMEAGEIFHMLVAVYLNMGGDFSVDDFVLEPQIQTWWEAFLAFEPVKTTSDTLLKVESSFEVALNDALSINGRVDCLRLTQDSIEIFDWKTGRPRSKSDLENDWQTRLYLALIAESRGYLGKADLPLDQISITYWYPREPEKSVKINYSEQWHAENWGYLRLLGELISAELQVEHEIWPLTSNLSSCTKCAYSPICGRESTDLTANLSTNPEDGDRQGHYVIEADAHPDL